MEKSEDFFKLKGRGTNVRIEVVAGITAFMTMAYVLVVQPGAIMAITLISGLIFVVLTIFGVRDLCQSHTQEHKGGHRVGNRFLHCLPGI
ncbi:hypothetical protein QMP26_08125 [Enterocloster clostridioformis]|uniref:hypothetical protein n=1 Tax=Enterocloster clostridioformis TaxID=1531 RepID=UPI0026749CE4|nr:hypothetical protein [Enterocloster clostridioformis]